MEGTPHDAIVQGAYSVPNQANRDTVLQHMDLAPFCAQRDCRLFRDRQLLDETAVVALESGHSLCIRIAAPHEPTQTDDLTAELHFEDLSLMQAPRSFPPHTTAEQPTAPASSCPMNPNAQVFQPDRPNLWLFPDFVQDLHSAFVSATFAWEDEVTSAQVLVWFVDHRFQFPSCMSPRVVTLTDDFTDWEQRPHSCLA